MSHGLQVTIDPDVCVSSGECVRLAPGAFGLEIGETAHVVDPSSETREALLLAERTCPSGAIRIDSTQSV